MKGITMSFGPTRALAGVDLSVSGGEVVALLGENGAGKSTLLKVLSGVWPHGRYGGEVRLRGPDAVIRPARFRDTRDALAAGVSMIHQELSVFPELTVGEHLELGGLPRWIRWKELHRRCQSFLDGLGFGLRSTDPVKALSTGGRQLVEIAKALYRGSRVLVFDEPTSALSQKEVERLYGIVRKLRAEGRAVLYVTHRFDEVFELADRVVVLRDGRNAGEAPIAPRQELESRIISWMVGREINDVYPPLGRFGDETCLAVDDLSVRRGGRVLVGPASFRVRRGEILGLGGLLGAGRTECFDAIFGALAGHGPRGGELEVRGEIRVGGQVAHGGFRSPRAAMEAGLAYVTEDRKLTGLVLGHSILDNMTLPALAGRRSALADGPARCRSWWKELRLRADRLEQPVRELSGGNQQKVVLGKWLMTEPRVLLLDEPTRGVDVGAKIEIYQWIHRMAESGIGVVLASSELPELLGLCHRVLVLRQGRFSAELQSVSATQEEFMRAAAL